MAIIGIYKITNKINGKCYIGQSINIKARWESHKYYTYEVQTKLQHAFSKYGIANFEFTILEKCTPDQLDEKEQYWIDYYNSFENGYNMTLGGTEGRTHDYDAIITEFNTTKSIHATARNLNMSRTTIRKVLDIYHIEYEKNNSLPKKVLMIDPKTLQIIKVFPSVIDAANYIHLSDSAIRKCLAGKSKTSGGYYWQTENSNIELKQINSDEEIIIGNKAKPILQYDLEYNLIAEYKSIGEANKAIGKSRSNYQISKACLNHNEYMGYFWEFKK